MTRGIDHLVLAVRDLDKARAFYEALGFTVTPRALHPWGTANHLVQMRGCFLELLGIGDTSKITPPTAGEFSFAAHNRDFLAKREGMSMLVFQSHDARRDRDEFAAAGIGAYPPFHFGRDATLPDGSTARVAFTLAFATDLRMPDQAFFTCQQHAPKYFWKTAYQEHANGARTIAEVFLVAPDPHALADFFAKLQGRESVRTEGGTLRVDTARGRLTIMPPAAYAARFPGGTPAVATPHLAGFRIAGADPEAEAKRLAESGIRFHRAGTSVWIPPSAAFGTTITFTAETAGE